MPKRIEAWEDGQGGIHRTEREAILAHANYELRNFTEACFNGRSIDEEEALVLLRDDADEWLRLIGQYVRAKQTKEEPPRFPYCPACASRHVGPQCLTGEPKEEVLSLSRTPRKP